MYPHSLLSANAWLIRVRGAPNGVLKSLRRGGRGGVGSDTKLLRQAPPPLPPKKMSTFERSLLGTTISYEGLAEHGKRYIPKLAGRRVPDPFRRVLENTKFSKLIKVKKLKKQLV